MWSKLSMKDRAKYIQLGVANGVTSLDEIRKEYNKYAEGGFIKDSLKPWYWGTPTYEGENLKEALFKAYDAGLEGKNILYNDKAYKVSLNDADLNEYNTKKQHKANKAITPEQVVDSYIENVVWEMENPTHETLGKDGLYYPYTDVDKKGNTHYNIGAGIEKNSDIAAKYKIDYSGKTGYEKEVLDNMMRADLEKKATESMQEVLEEYPNLDTLSLGNRMILLDIAHNVRPRGAKRKNMPKQWPELMKAMNNGDYEGILNNVYSGSTRRQKMRGDLIWKNTIDSNTVRNRALGGYIYKSNIKNSELGGIPTLLGY
jgi:hypothetical protein